VNVGSNTYVRTARILEVDDFDLISLDTAGNFPLLNINFFDRFNNWIAVVHENFWVVDTSMVWDVEYRPRHLIIRNIPRQISLDVHIKNDEIVINGKMYFNGVPIEMTDDETLFGGRRGGALSHCKITDCGVALSLHTR